jgi:hypothetical protein
MCGNAVLPEDCHGLVLIGTCRRDQATAELAGQGPDEVKRPQVAAGIQGPGQLAGNGEHGQGPPAARTAGFGV